MVKSEALPRLFARSARGVSFAVVLRRVTTASSDQSLQRTRRRRRAAEVRRLGGNGLR